jgi:hypothetical protein
MEDSTQHVPNKYPKQPVLILVSVLLLALAALLGGTATAQSQATVKLSLSTTVIDQGETVDVALRVENVRNLYGAQLDLHFDPARLTVQDADPATEGIQVALRNFLRPDFVVVNEADNEAGTLRLAFTQVSPSAPVEGSGDLAVVTFAGVGSGSAALTLGQVILADMDGQEIQARLEGAEVRIEQGLAATPLLAGGAGIMGIALVSLVGWMWARRQAD